MKALFLIIIILLRIDFSSQKYQPIPNIQFNYIVSSIIPSPNVNKWEYRSFDCFDKSTEVIYTSEQCDSTIKAYNPLIEAGFIEGCHPLLCYDYIVAKINGELKLINNKKEAFEFIGVIDNLAEGILSLQIQDYGYYYTTNKNIETGGYYMDRDSIHFKVLKEDWSSNSILIGQYLISIHKNTHEMNVKRLKTFSEKKL